MNTGSPRSACDFFGPQFHQNKIEISNKRTWTLEYGCKSNRILNTISILAAIMKLGWSLAVSTFKKPDMSYQALSVIQPTAGTLQVKTSLSLLNSKPANPAAAAVDLTVCAMSGVTAMCEEFCTY